MAESKHTPGPWRIHCNLYAEAGDNLIVAKAEQFTDYKVSMANARLIAAAPELLEALKRIERRVLKSAACDEPGCTCRAELARVRAIIAKADGRAP